MSSGWGKVTVHLLRLCLEDVWWRRVLQDSHCFQVLGHLGWRRVGESQKQRGVIKQTKASCKIHKNEKTQIILFVFFIVEKEELETTSRKTEWRMFINYSMTWERSCVMSYWLIAIATRGRTSSRNICMLPFIKMQCFPFNNRESTCWC